MSASLGLSPVSQFVSHLALSFTLAGVLCPPSVGCCVRLSPVLSPNLSPAWLYLAPWSGCCVRLAGLVSQIYLPSGFVSQFCLPICLPLLSFTLAKVLCPALPQFCLPICFPSGFVFHLGWGIVSASLGLSPVLSPNMSPNLSPIWLCLSPGVLCPPRWACLRSCRPLCLPPGFVFHLGWGGLSPNLFSNLSRIWFCFSQAVYCWGSQCCRKRARLGRGAVSASLGLSPHLFPNLSLIWLCLPVLSFHLFPIWLCLLGWGVVSASLGLSAVSQFVSQFVFHLGWSAVSPSRGLSPNLSPIWLCLPVLSVPYLVLSGAPCPPRWACRPICLPRVSHFALSFTLAGALRPPRWDCLPICLPPGIVFHLGWGAASTPLGLSANLSPIWLCLLPWLGCCVSLIRFVCGPPICLPSGFVSQFSLAICFPFSFVFHLGWGAVYTYLPTYLLRLLLLLLLLLNVFSALSDFSVVFDFCFVSADFFLP